MHRPILYVKHNYCKILRIKFEWRLRFESLGSIGFLK